uniref:CTNNB1_binding domain-containing protein n=1 Tax=Macrostomum lignano TaxID=282301 RepID=A0A1I8J6P5_9PLAT
MQLSAYSDQQENRPYDPQVDSNNPFGYSMFQTEATDLMPIEVASMAGTPSEQESADHEDEDDQEEGEDGGNESNIDSESNGRDTPRPSPDEEPQSHASNNEMLSFYP